MVKVSQGAGEIAATRKQFTNIKCLEIRRLVITVELVNIVIATTWFVTSVLYRKGLILHTKKEEKKIYIYRFIWT